MQVKWNMKCCGVDKFQFAAIEIKRVMRLHHPFAFTKTSFYLPAKPGRPFSVSYSFSRFANFIRTVAASARVAVPFGSRVLFPLPLIRPLPTAQLSAGMA